MIKISGITYRRFLALYAVVFALLAGWLLFEKMPDGREELINSMENTFRENWEQMAQHNNEVLKSIQERVLDYPGPQATDYQNRAIKALALTELFGTHAEEKGASDLLSPLKDSLLLLMDHDELCRSTVDGIVNHRTLNPWINKNKGLKMSQLRAQVQLLGASTLNYCATKTGGHIMDCSPMRPGFLPVTLAPQVGQVCKADICLVDPYQKPCATYSGWFNHQPLVLKEGVARIRTTFSTPGLHKLHVRFRRERCRDGLVTEVGRDFQINVLAKCDSIK